MKDRILPGLRSIAGIPAIATIVLGCASMAAAVTPLPRIAARSASPAGQFYNTATGATFTPSGSNYIRLDYLSGKEYHCTFTTGFYDSTQAENALSFMHSCGYNVVRVFIDPGDGAHQAMGRYGTGGPASTNSATLYGPYLANFVDFLERATRYGIYVIPVLNYVPCNTYYNSLCDIGRPANITSSNTFYLYAGAVDSKAQYVRQFVQSVKAADSGALLPTVFAYELQNEAGCDTVDGPFNLHSGMVSTQDGMTYDMASPSSRQQCQDSNTNRWISRCVDSIKTVDSQAMVGCSVFTFAAVGKPGPNGLMPVSGADERYPARPYWLDRSTLSYIDLHEYPQGAAWSLSNDLNSSEFSSIDLTSKPVLQGEFGASRGIYPDSTSAAYAMRDQANNTKSRGFAGHLLWTWDDDTEPFWTMLDNNGAINGVLAPIVGQ